jgi:hypothetical protein
LNDLVVGLATGYTWPQIEPWLISLERTGYTGIRTVVLDDSSPDLEKLEEKLRSRGCTVRQVGSWYIPFVGQLKAPHTEKFRIVAEILDEQEFRFVVLTDLRDLIFQTDPILWLQNNLADDKGIAVATESVRHGDSDWLMDNMFRSFGREAEQRMKNEEVYNSGVVAGRASVIKDFFRAIYNKCLISPHGLPDQAAMNLLLRQEPWHSQTQFNSVASGMVLNARSGSLNSQRMEKEIPVWTDEGVSINGKLFCMVHQYPHYCGCLERKYRE